MWFLDTLLAIFNCLLPGQTVVCLVIFNYLLPTRPDGVINAEEEDHVLGWVDVHHLAKKIKNILCILVLFCFQLFVHCLYVSVFLSITLQKNQEHPLYFGVALF